MGDKKFSASLISGKEHVADFRKPESHSIICPDRKPPDLTCIAVNAGRDVNAQNRLSAQGDKFDDIAVKSSDIGSVLCRK